MRMWEVAWRRFWPGVLLLFGTLSLLPLSSVRAARLAVEELLLSPAGLLRAFSSERVALASEPLASPPHEVFAAIERAGAHLLPPESWSAGGRFRALPLGGTVAADFARFAVAGEVPARQPVLLGDLRLGTGFSTEGSEQPDSAVALVGFTERSDRGIVGLRPITATAFSLPAVARSRNGEREVRFTAAGDGSSTLRVVAPDRRSYLREGDLVFALTQFGSDSWASDWSPPAGSEILLGRIDVDPTEPRWEEAARVRPFFELNETESVAVRFPDGWNVPSARSLTAVRAAVLRSGRGSSGDVFFIDRGREDGLVRGTAVAASGRFVGRVMRAGLGTSQVLRLESPAAEIRVLLLARERAQGCVLRPVERAELGVFVEGMPDHWDEDEAAVVTALSSATVPPGLVVGRLTRVGDRWLLRTTQELPDVVTLFLGQRHGARGGAGA